MFAKLVVGAATAVLCSAAFAQSVTLPPNILNDQAAVRAALAKLVADRATRPIDSALLKTDIVALRLEIAQLVKDAKPLLGPDVTALQAAVAQLKADVLANNPDAIAADKTAIKAIATQLKADRRAIFGRLPVLPPVRRR